MSRIDALLEQAMATGEIPATATEAERAELEELLAGRATLLTARTQVDREAATTMPIARARFERFVADQQQPAAPRVAVASPRPGFLARLAGHHRGLLLSGSAIAIGLLAVIGLASWQAFSSGTDIASAQALYPEDYVQVQGIVASMSGQGATPVVTLDSSAGRVQVTLTSETSIIDQQKVSDAAAIKAGAELLIGGTATNSHAIVAHTIALSKADATRPNQVRLQALARLLPNLQGRVTMLTISKDGKQARVLIDAANGKRYLVNVNVQTAEELLRLSSTALGAVVQVNPGQSGSAGVFNLSVLSPAGGTASPSSTTTKGQTPAGATFVTVRGVVTGRQGNLLEVATRDGMETVQVRPLTRRLLGGSGLTRADIEKPDAIIGHTVAVAGGLDAKNGHVLADLLVVGPRVH